ncbi:hypothetical protein EJD97_003386 [Solanum chilense]|uniref:CCHC-type domain-containing protein n=1 Tax=Solanum chilense TaxID=4083 RepID=A0A6N2BZE8_SOLCI|nr:hypothetical protein EJD97_003386 [Solanum chilense]
MWSRYDPYLIFNPRYEMRRFVTGFAGLVSEDCHTTMIKDGMTLARIMVYAQSIEDSKLGWIDRILKSSESNDQSQPMFKKKIASQGERRSAKVKFDKGNGSQNGKPTCATCGKRHNRESLLGIGRFFGCCKYGHKVIDCRTRDG